MPRQSLIYNGREVTIQNQDRATVRAALLAYEQGATYAVIDDRFGLNQSTMHRYVKAVGISRGTAGRQRRAASTRHGRNFSEIRARAIDLRARGGYTTSAIAVMVGVHQRTVQRWFAGTRLAFDRSTANRHRRMSLSTREGRERAHLYRRLCTAVYDGAPRTAVAREHGVSPCTVLRALRSPHNPYRAPSPGPARRAA